MSNNCGNFFSKLARGKNGNLSLRKEIIFFCHFVTFLQVIVRKKGVVLVVVGIRKGMKHNAKNAESKIFIAFI